MQHRGTTESLHTVENQMELENEGKERRKKEKKKILERKVVEWWLRHFGGTRRTLRNGTANRHMRTRMHTRAHLWNSTSWPRKRDARRHGNIGHERWARERGRLEPWWWDIVFVNEHETMNTAIYGIKRKTFSKNVTPPPGRNCSEDKWSRLRS